MNGLTALVQGRDYGRGVSIVFTRQDNGFAYSVKAPGGEWIPDDMSGQAVDLDPLRISDDEARALTEALVRYFSGTEDTRQLRKDYDAERQRVDGLITLVGSTLQGLTNLPRPL